MKYNFNETILISRFKIDKPGKRIVAVPANQEKLK